MFIVVDVLKLQSRTRPSENRISLNNNRRMDMAVIGEKRVRAPHHTCHDGKHADTHSLAQEANNRVDRITVTDWSIRSVRDRRSQTRRNYCTETRL